MTRTGCDAAFTREEAFRAPRAALPLFVPCESEVSDGAGCRLQAISRALASHVSAPA